MIAGGRGTGRGVMQGGAAHLTLAEQRVQGLGSALVLKRVYPVDLGDGVAHSELAAEARRPAGYDGLDEHLVAFFRVPERELAANVVAWVRLAAGAAPRHGHDIL